MTKVIAERYLGDFQVALQFSDGAEGVFDGRALLQQHAGSLLAPLREEEFFRRCFVDAGALCWPNGLELSPTKLRENVKLTETV